MYYRGIQKYFLKPKFFFLRSLKINIYEYPKKNYERQNFVYEKASYFRYLKSSI